uniref:Iron receptor-like protein n=1 Tax=Stenotrophomonas maltophilia TaxID=40324 RepID=Q6UVM2_STEMA|nr:iron receptor-like protein [Stenotrophomonas maltophilia]
MLVPTGWSRSPTPRVTCWRACPIRMARSVAATTCRGVTCSASRRWSSSAACPAWSMVCRASRPSVRSTAARWRCRSAWPMRTCWHPGGRTCRHRWRSCWPTSWCCWCCCMRCAAVPAASRRWPRN